MPTICNRDGCPKPLGTHRVSWFNTDAICSDCQKQEEAHPDYKHAKEVEHAAVLKGNTNFPGVGWPGVKGRVPR